MKNHHVNVCFHSLFTFIASSSTVFYAVFFFLIPSICYLSNFSSIPAVVGQEKQRDLAFLELTCWWTCCRDQHLTENKASVLPGSTLLRFFFCVSSYLKPTQISPKWRGSLLILFLKVMVVFISALTAWENYLWLITCVVNAVVKSMCDVLTDSSVKIVLLMPPLNQLYRHL